MSEPAISFLEGRGGERVCYAVHGNGPFLFCPAWWVSHVERDWRRPAFRDFFARLGQGLTVVRYDRPGVGLSDPGHEATTLEDDVALLETLVERLDAPRLSLFGTSSGAPTAITFAARHPERVARLALYGAYADGHDLAGAAVRKAMVEMVRAHWGLASRVLADVFVPDLSGPELEAYAVWQREACEAATAARLLELTYEMNVIALLPAVRNETLVVHRRDDRAVPFEAARRLAAGIQGARLQPLDGRAHPPWEGASDAAEQLVAFLTERPPDAARSESACRLDRGNCEVVLEERRVPLTPLELAVLAYLGDRPNRVVRRAELLSDVWRRPHVGSNVVDGVVRTLRKKLGPYRDSIQTVTGHGYRFSGWVRLPD